MQKTFGILLLLTGASFACWAPAPITPEIDPASGGSAIALVAGALLVLRARKK